MKYLILVFAFTISAFAFSAPTDKKMNGSDINTPTAKPRNDAHTQLDDLVRGEMSAVKTYSTVLKDTKDQKVKSKLEAIRKDHQEAVNALSKYVAGKTDLLEDTESSGAWGAFANTWTKGAELMGNKTALKALSQGEEHGVDEYQEALKDETIPQDLKKMITSKYLPAQKKHMETLKTLL